MKLSDFKYPLPRNLIAKQPANPRDHSRLMVLNRAENAIEGRKFYEIAEYFQKGDCLVVNETRVFQARLYGKKERMRKSKSSYCAS
jgi:S-adenosylmethionine:tRNA ribosyltransferase-isomerase